MAYVALIAWFVTALGGLYMLAVWLIENDATNQRHAASRLPLPVIVAHMSLAVTGLAVWVGYLLLDREVLAWAAVGILFVIVSLGLTMVARWIPVYRTTGAHAQPVRAASGSSLFDPAPTRATAIARAGSARPGPATPRSASPGPATPRSASPGPATPRSAGPGPATPRSASPGPATPPYDTPPEGAFPLFVVLAHGTLAISTVVLVVLTALGVGGS